jgi:predicted TIM-barrel fold metal-dependent hydrolase
MWSNSRRPPDSREEDSWLSDAQQRRVAPAETEPFVAPVPTRMVSNGEYMPHPQTDDQKHVEYRVKELADEAAKRLGTTRRRFLMGTGGLAASFLAMNEVYGKKLFNVSPVEMYETAAYAENGVPQDVFVFDDQTHIVRTSMNGGNALRALAQGPGPASMAAGYTSNPFNGTGGNPAGVDEFGNPWADWNPAQLGPAYPPNSGAATTALGEFHLGQYINRMYLQSQTSISIISNANLALFTAPGTTVPGPATNISESLQSEILTGYQTSMCRDFINNLAGSRRAFAHAQIYPGVGNLEDPAFGDYTQWQIEFCQPDSWKGYNIAYAASPFPGAEFAQWRLDDETIAYPTYAVINANRNQLRKHPGFFNICIHKGLAASGTQPGGANNTPDYGNPDDIVKVATDWPQFNWIIYHSCFRPDFWSLQALLDIQNAPGSMAPTTLTDSDGHTVPNIRWSTQFAQICGGKYVAGAEPTSTSPSSHRPLRNVYTELGTTMASMIVTFPTAWAHLIGQQLYYMGSEHIVFGSDSLWYGGPQWQVEALWRFQIPDDIAERWGYPQLTEYDKRQILGLNSARLYGLYGRQAVGVGEPGSPYRQGNLARYAPLMQPGSAIDTVLEGVGYPTPITPADSAVSVSADLIPNDNFTRLKRQRTEAGAGRSNARFGWMRTQ